MQSQGNSRNQYNPQNRSQRGGNNQPGATGYTRNNGQNPNWNPQGPNFNRNGNGQGGNPRQQGNWNNQPRNQGGYNQRQNKPPAHVQGKENAEGSKFEIEVNYLDLILDPKTTSAYHYDVKIDRDSSKASKTDKVFPKRFLRPAFDKFCSEVFPNVLIAFDGIASCYSIVKLDSSLLKPKEITVCPEIGKPMDVIVSVTETKDSLIDLTALKK